jgi:hypothetical protein
MGPGYMTGVPASTLTREAAAALKRLAAGSQDSTSMNAPFFTRLPRRSHRRLIDRRAQIVRSLFRSVGPTRASFPEVKFAIPLAQRCFCGGAIVHRPVKFDKWSPPAKRFVEGEPTLCTGSEMARSTSVTTHFNVFGIPLGARER